MYGRPYTVDETNAHNGYWAIHLDGSGSYNNEAGNLSYWWDLGTATFDGTHISRQKWAYSSDVEQNDAIIIHGAYWGTRYLCTKDTYNRTAGMGFESKVRIGSGGQAVFGFKNTNTAYSYREWPYAIFFDNGTLRIYEDGNPRNATRSYTHNAWYDVRIELKENQGARYYYRENGAADWMLVYDSNYNSASSFKIGWVANSGALEIDDMREMTAGESPTSIVSLKETNTVSLTVRNQFGQEDSDNTTITLSTPPTADAGRPYTVNETDADKAGYYTLVLDGFGSSDNESPSLTYLWDFGKNSFSGTQLSHHKWTHSNYVSQDGYISIIGGHWGMRYLYTKNSYSRIHGMAFESKVRQSSGQAIFGFKDTGNTYNYFRMPYAIYFDNGTIRIYENGNPRRVAGSYNYNTWYDVRIELKEHRGAQYYFRTSGSNDWILLYDSYYGDADAFRLNAVVNSGILTIDDMREFSTEASPVVLLYGADPRQVSLTTWDLAGQTSTETTEVNFDVEPPVADAGQDISTEPHQRIRIFIYPVVTIFDRNAPLWGSGYQPKRYRHPGQ